MIIEIVNVGYLYEALSISALLRGLLSSNDSDREL